MDAFYNNEDARRRLNGCILFYDGEPVFLQSYDGGTFCMYKLGKVVGGNYTLIKYTDPKLTDDIPRLGYVNRERQARYIMRHVIRDQRNGLPTEAIYSHDGNFGSGGIYSDDMANMLMNKYPSVSEAHANVTKNRWESCAFSKSYAFDHELNILHCGRVIGRLIKSPFGYEVEYSPYLKKLSFFMRNFGDRFNNEIRSLKNG